MQTKKLNIALIGYGKMGKIIESIALKRGHDILIKTTSRDTLSQNINQLKNIDVAIEFTSPDNATHNLRILADSKVPTICGTTGWLEQFEEIIEKFKSNNTPFLYASNFSVGVNVFFELNEFLARMMNRINDYDVSLFESHHTEKKDAPSGTAVTLAQQIIKELDIKTNWAKEDNEDTSQLYIESHREGDVKGLHEVKYNSNVDQIIIRHEAFNREGFALGALMAAEFIHDKKGLYTMKDVLKV